MLLGQPCSRKPVSFVEQTPYQENKEPAGAIAQNAANSLCLLSLVKHPCDTLQSRAVTEEDHELVKKASPHSRARSRARLGRRMLARSPSPEEEPLREGRSLRAAGKNERSLHRISERHPDRLALRRRALRAREGLHQAGRLAARLRAVDVHCADRSFQRRG